MEQLPQVIVNNLLTGGIYALVAVGITIIHGVMKIVNFAQGDFLAIGMYLAYAMHFLLPGESYPYWLIVPVGAGMYLIGCIIFQTAIRRVIGKGDSNYILLTIGLSYFIQNVLQLIFGADFKNFSMPDTLRYGSFEVIGTVFTLPRVIAFLFATVFVLFLNWFLSKTDTGRAMRATSENRIIAESLGIKSRKAYITAFALGTMFAGIAGLMLSPLVLPFPKVGAQFSTIAMSAMVLGGLGNIKGAMVGALIIGLVESATSTYINVNLAQAAICFVLMLVLIFKPYGIFGKKARVA